MNTVDSYIRAATRDNTRKSYQAAIEHFEVEWKGFLPATPDSIASYLAHYAPLLATSTLRQRLAALAQWHTSQGFPDPTKAPVVRQVMRGIRALHPNQERQARPLQLDVLDSVDTWLGQSITESQDKGERPTLLRHLRNRALLLMGFWRGFRGDELARMQIEHVNVVIGEGMVCYLPRSKGDRENRGTSYKTPALSRLCPVEAYLAWVSAAHLDGGPVFRSIDRWGNVGPEGLHVDSIPPLLRTILAEAGIDSAELYSGHSLRRGFASWASANGWDLKTLMNYVGWRHVQSAMRYVDAPDPFSRRRIEAALPMHDN